MSDIYDPENEREFDNSEDNLEHESEVNLEPESEQELDPEYEGEYEYEEEYEEEEDEGYSIPKILVAVLLLVVAGTIFFIFSQQRKIKNVVTMLRSEKEQVDKELNQMIEMYNLAKDDNDNLSDELKDEQDRLIKFRDSVRKLGKSDVNEKVREEISKIKQRSSLVFDDNKSNSKTTNKTSNNNSSGITITRKPADDVSKTSVEANKTNGIKTGNKDDNDVASTSNDKPVETAKEPASTKKEEAEDYNKVFTRTEIPPTFPGCSGTPVQIEACFQRKVKENIAKRFNPSVASGLNLKSGRNRVYVRFTVDKFGNVKNISAKGPHEKLEQEAINAAKKLPKMRAARQNGIPVSAKFTIPITFMVE